MRRHRVSSQGIWYCHPASTSAPMFNQRVMSMVFFRLWNSCCALQLRCTQAPPPPPRQKVATHHRWNIATSRDTRERREGQTSITP